MLSIDSIVRLGQQEVDSGSIFREYLRGVVVASLSEIMAQEVEGLCGSAYSRDKEVNGYRRAGSAPLGFDFEGEILRRPRVRKKSSKGESEIKLSSVEAARQARSKEIQEEILKLYLAGVPSREVKDLSLIHI